MIQFNKQSISGDTRDRKDHGDIEEIIDVVKSVKKVLIVDDSSYNLIVMKEMIGAIKNDQGVEYQIKTALNGQEALEVIQESIV